MIIGIGTDLVNICRIEKILMRFGERFIDRLFTIREKVKCQKRVTPEVEFAKIFAAKEACSKALGTGLSKGIYWHDLGVDNLTTGQPILQLTGGAKVRLDEMLPTGYKAQLDLSLTDEYPFAHALVVISANPV